MPLHEPGQVIRGRAGEGVDRLVLVADDAQVVALAEPQLQEPLLERVRVLVLVDAEPAFPGADRRAGIGVDLEEVDRLDQEVVEVDAPGPGLGPLVVDEDAGDQVGRDRRLAARGRRGPVVGARRDPPGLRPLDLVGQVLRRGEAVVTR